MLGIASSPSSCGDDSSSSFIDQVVMIRAMKMYTSKLAKVYGSKTREALMYAKLVAQEDDKIALAILATDLPASASTTDR